MTGAMGNNFQIEEFEVYQVRVKEEDESSEDYE